MSSLPTNQVSAAFAIVSSTISIGTLAMRHLVVKPKPIAREHLVTSMLLSGLINSINTMVSGSLFLASGSLPPRGSVACSTSGFLRQWTLQALDFTLLVITLTTVSVLMVQTFVSELKIMLDDHFTQQKTNSVGIMDAISKRIWYILGSVWGVSFATAIAAQFIIGYAPTGAWCSIAQTPAPLAIYARFGFNHGPRIAIFLVMMACYGVLFTVLLQRRRLLKQAFQGGSTGETSSAHKSDKGEAKLKEPPNAHTTLYDRRLTPSAQQTTATAAIFGHRRSNSLFRSMVLLTLYPVTYIILWAPNIVNRIYEPMGIVNSTLALLQNFSLLQPAANSVVWLVTHFVRSRSNSNSVAESHTVPLRSRAQSMTPATKVATTAPANHNPVIQETRTINGE
ncbi:hypothetical protein BJ742DRAFT_860054 [Cladochytrium replicatum]|nr:hypothetical protein BJ742DRAFT_860054 [Cladochytrium replicatum]